jgi:hypothetical protein
VLQAAHAVAFRHADTCGTGQQRERCGEERDDYKDGVSTTHRR